MGDEFGHRHSWQRRAIVAFAVFVVLLLICHRPLLLFVGRHVAIHYAKKEHLKLNLTLEGSVFTNLIARNVHAVGSAPSEIQSIDADFVRVDYSLFDLIRGRKFDFLHNLELRSAKIVTQPRPEPFPPKKRKRATLFAIFPDRVRATDISFTIQDRPHELVFEHVDLILDPRAPGELRIRRLQLPAGQNWADLHASTSYTNRNLVLRDLVLNDQDRISLANIDASQIRSKRLVLNVEGKMGGGATSGTMTFRQTATSVDTDIQVEAKNIDAAAINQYAGLPKDYLGGKIEEVSIQGHGTVDSPRTWNGNVNAQVNDLRAGGIHFDRCTVQGSAQNATATLESVDAVEEKNAIHLHGWINLPDKIADLRRAPANLELESKDIELRQLTAGMPQPIDGLAEANGKIEIKNSVVSAVFNLTAGPVKFQGGELEKAVFDVTASKTISASNSPKPWFADLKSKINLNVSNLRNRDYVIDSMTGSLNSSNDLVQIEQLDLRRKQNAATVVGRYRLPADFRNPSPTGDVQLTIAAPEMADFWVPDSPNKWSGPFQGDGQIYWKNGVGNGALNFSSTGIRTRGLELRQLNAQCSIANNIVYLNDFRTDMTDQDFVRADGTVDLSGQHQYRAKISANISDLSKLQPLLRSFGNQNSLAGSLVIDWNGSGDAIKFKDQGQLKLTLEKGQYGNLKSLQANVDAAYSPEGLSIPTVFFKSDQMDFQAIVEAKGETLEITKIQLDQGQAKYASGYISLPFVWKNLGTDAAVIPGSGAITANFQSENIDIKKLFENFGMKPPASGILNVKLDAQGTGSRPNAKLEIEMRDLKSTQVPKLEPAAFHLIAQSAGGQLTINGKLEQAKVQPIELVANLPFDLARIAQDKRLADDTPVKATLKMPRSSVNFVRQFMPTVQEVDGDAAIDVDIGGTVGKPVFKGQADMTVNVARTTDPTLPALQNFKARLTFANDVLTLDQFAGELSGGHFTASGRISVPKLTTADVDLTFKADSALVARSEALAIRTSADVQLKGPINSVNVTGNVTLTNSHILKNLDLIPITLPGRPPPQAAVSHPQLTLPPQFRDWKFDVAIKTKEPVLIRGNLATGGAVVDLRFAGTGARPGLNGLVRLENVEATLPFSRLEIAYGFLYFNPDDSLNPKIDLHGTSLIQDYTVHVYIYGTALTPEAIFSSEPPLPQEDLISLLSTGTTREQLTGNNNVLAGRAATLLVQQVYRKVFKKGQATQSNSVFDRFDLDVGTVDPRTGQQQATARFKINNQFMLVGDLGVGGDYKGMVKYLIRFH